MENSLKVKKGHFLKRSEIGNNAANFLSYTSSLFTSHAFNDRLRSFSRKISVLKIEDSKQKFKKKKNEKIKCKNLVKPNYFQPTCSVFMWKVRTIQQSIEIDPVMSAFQSLALVK